MSTVIVVPFRDKGDARRRDNAAYVIGYLRGLNIAQVVVVDDGRTGDAPFNRSAAYNRGRAAAPDADVYVFYEADMIVPLIQLVRGIEAAAVPGAGLVVPFTNYRYLSPDDSTLVLDGALATDFTPEYTMADGRSIGAVGIASAVTLDAVGQWDETLSGWGYDDNCMFRAFEVCANPAQWVEGDGWHLYHTPGWSADSKFRGGAQISATEQAATDANRRRLRLYKQATTPERIRYLTAGGR